MKGLLPKKSLLANAVKINATPLDGKEKFIDVSCALSSRQFDRDRDRVISRSKSEGVSGIITWFADYEKQEPLADLCKTYPG